jgi:hypothetical protein
MAETKTGEERERIEVVIDDIKEHLNTRYELVVLKAAERGSSLAAGIISQMLIAFISVLAIIILSFAAAYYISSVRNDQYSGFIIVGGVYLLLVMICVMFRKKLLSNPFRNMIIREFFKEEK